MFRLLTVTLISLLLTSPVIAEEHCATFDDHSIGVAFPAPGAVLFKDDIFEIRSAGFAVGYGAAEVIPDNGIGVSQKVISLNNSSFHLISRVPFAAANAQVRDQGGFEMVGVTGAFPTDIELHDNPNVSTPLAKIEGGINSPNGVGRIHWETTTDQLLFSLIAGGQEFSVGMVCIESP